MDDVYINCPSANQQKMLLFSKASRQFWKSDVYTDLLYDVAKLKISMIKEGLIETKLVKEECINTSRPLEGLTVLDVGCGGGFMSEPLAELGCRVVGIDICSGMIEVAKRHAALNPALSNLTYLYESIEEHSKSNREKYDVVIVAEVIIHVQEQDLFLKETLSCLKPGGFVYISNCNKTWGCWLAGVVLAEWILRFIPRGVYSWDKHCTPEEFIKKLQMYNCQTKNVRGMLYNPFSNVWFWSKYKFFYYSIYAIKDTI